MSDTGVGKYNVVVIGAGTIHAGPTLAEMARKLGDQVQRTRLTPTARKVFSWIYRRARA